jgi:hypothetical protein
MAAAPAAAIASNEAGRATVALPAPAVMPQPARIAAISVWSRRFVTACASLRCRPAAFAAAAVPALRAIAQRRVAIKFTINYHLLFC